MFESFSGNEELEIKFNRCKAAQEFITDSLISDEDFLRFLLDMYKQFFQPVLLSSKE